MITSKELEQDMANYYGTENWYRLFPFSNFLITDDVKAFAEKAGAFWFVTEVFTMVHCMPDDLYEIKLLVKDEKADIIISTNKEVKRKHIAFTDCPEGEWIFFYTNNVFLWHGEY